ncbi:hypothetical protein [Microcoleus sp. T2B6]|uniref:hypothetical protein n=1 Tax=Microcoleus sp. T2B6 TaxID=3055424 RepID=UPI002FD421B2
MPVPQTMIFLWVGPESPPLKALLTRVQDVSLTDNAHSHTHLTLSREKNPARL